VSAVSIAVLAFFTVVGCCRKDDKGFFTWNYLIVGVIGRLVLLYYTMRTFSQVNAAWASSSQNLVTLDSMAEFAPTTERCGSPYTAMNVDKANEYLLDANDAVRKSRIAVMTILIWISIELLPVVLMCVFGCGRAFCCGRGGS